MKINEKRRPLLPPAAVALILLALALLPLFGAYAGSPAMVAQIVVKPPTGNYVVGEIIDVEVWVEDVVDLYGVDIRLAFDATRLQVLDADPNLPGIQVLPRNDILSPDFVIKREADNELGTVWYAATQVNPTLPASGSGALFSFSFEAVAAGTAVVEVTNHQLADQNGNLIPSQASGAAYQITGDPSATPTATPTGTPPATATPTSTATATDMATSTATATGTATSTATATAVATATPTATPQPTVDTALRILPAAGAYPVGETLFVEIWVEDVVNLYAVDVRLAFDTGRLQVQDAEPTLPGVQVIPRADLLSPDFIVRREADNEAGTVWYAVTQINPHQPVSGSGALFAFTFDLLVEGTALVTVSEVTLTTIDGDLIPATTFGATYELSGGNSLGYNLFLPAIQQNTP